MSSHAAHQSSDGATKPAKSRTADRRHLARAWTMVRHGVSDLLDDQPLEKAAAVSYYTLLALAPLLLVVLAIAGMVFGREAVTGQLVGEMRGLIGERGAEAIQLVIESASASGASKVSFGFGLITLLVGASGVFVELQAALNKSGASRRRRSAVRVHYGEVLPWSSASPALNALGSLLVLTLWIAMIFKFLPEVKMAWRDVWIGALATAVPFTLGESAIGAYIGRASISSSYGAAGSVVVLVAWVYSKRFHESVASRSWVGVSAERRENDAYSRQYSEFEQRSGRRSGARAAVAGS